MTEPTPLVRVTSLQGHAETAWSLAWNPKYKLLATCSTDRDVRLHAYQELPSVVTSEKQMLFTLQDVIPTGHKRTVRQVAWSPSGDILATASFDCSIGIWERTPQEILNTNASDEPEWECSGTLEGHDSECKGVAFSHNGSLLASCSRDKSVWIWEVQPDSEFECLSVMMEHSQDVKAVAWHPHEEPYDLQLELDDWGFATGADGKINVFYIGGDVHVPQVRLAACVENGHDNADINCVAWAPVHKNSEPGNDAEEAPFMLASAGDDGVVHIWTLPQ
ncbi:Cytosolic iron-sulfur protein assembly protein [Malassezia vespertilionis]|uniref:Cytosolic iron-sulfur protein assembly protein n=1 Tax=Malassezia vespertilionis TaxID=2020962 RepID=UPI0024B14998|nr:Cytosolic iron-sulfur protein assembly protein [Malassezia vespertilionis]WFD07627.1 Cytosolic iron-sulfur protein assembly protein [Malassezia vespertilionis]